MNLCGYEYKYRAAVLGSAAPSLKPSKAEKERWASAEALAGSNKEGANLAVPLDRLVRRLAGLRFSLRDEASLRRHGRLRELLVVRLREASAMESSELAPSDSSG